MSDVVTPTPTNTTEEYLAAIANALQGLPANPLAPVWRHEEFLLAIIQAAGAIQKGVASTYDEDTNYGPGDYVAYEGKLYKCTAATTGEWDASDWTEAGPGRCAQPEAGHLSEGDGPTDRLWRGQGRRQELGHASQAHPAGASLPAPQ